ncbi:FG-GAP-like repeat-containing protein [Maribacter sp. 2308TA10-17]|uniref:FG-GAP-like repeat-containing protein n=1 Tax=Maribacter sp. 2308TA10-17 TaxID=3386276 RepID=UPI0039BC683F
MKVFQLLNFSDNLLHKIVFGFALIATSILSSQTTFTESGASYNLDITGNKDGGHAWSDYDNDGDVDVLILENSGGSNKSFLMRNNGNNTFTDVRATLVPGMLNDPAERQAAWGDLNSDGRPDFMIGAHGNSSSNPAALQIYLQNVSGTFGDGAGGTAPITVGRSGHTINVNPINSEGAGFFDFEGDGDLDIFFDSHAFGIELLRNNYVDHTTHLVVNPPASGLFTHITPGNGAGVVEYGLNQFATDGDYGSAADVNDDGWVDIFMRKRNENDFFLNQGGIFTNGSDLAQADNDNKGGNGLWDLDNDGDLDAVWTENGTTQIFRNDGPGIWVALGAAVFPGLPQPPDNNGSNSSAEIEALAGGDIDNDGDIDVLLVGDGRSYLYINQLNSPTPAPGVIGSGTAMTFTLDPALFNSGQNGEGTTMIDIDDDGDLDIYMSISGRNRLYINNLPAANRNNHLLIDVTEDRGANGATGGVPERVAIGTNIIIKDCNGNIISGLRQVNGVYGHGTQSPEEVHFGLPLGENETYVIEVRYPNYYDPVDGVKRLIGTIITNPSTIPGTNHYTLSTSAAEASENINAPDAVDDGTTVNDNYNISVQLNLFINDSEPDSENFFISSIVQPATGSVVIDDADAGLVTYTYNLGVPFSGTTFDYTISDSPIFVCPALGKRDTATVTINAKVPEDCSNGIDDDGDGLIDCDDPECNLNGNGYDWYFGLNAGLNFENAAGPVQIPSPLLNAEEGSSIWSDDQGNLLFYTNGINVYNRNHQVMPNGSGLLGNPSSTQSGVVVEDPGNPDRYYVFSIGGAGNLAYFSVVDMTLDGGLGDVIVGNKNTFIQNVNGEKIAAWPHSNGTDIWVVLVDTNNIYARLLTAVGLGPAITSNANSFGRRFGQMKFSPDGQKLAIGSYPNASSGFMVQLVDFDNSTGQFSNLQEWPLNQPYGVEFSPNGNYLYVTEMGWGGPVGRLWQYDIGNNSTGASIGASGVVLLSGNYMFAQLQIGPDGKIYMATSFTGNNPRNGLAVINEPNNQGLSSNAVADQITFTDGALSRSGLPNIPAYQLRSKPIITPVDVTQTCFSNIQLQLEAYGADSYQWLLDGVAIPGETNLTLDPDLPGQYQVEVTYGCDIELTEIYTLLLDTDNDCVPDVVDLDDDNDGILDIVERAKTVLWVTQGTPETEEQNTIDKLIALGYTVTVVDDNVGGNANDYSVTFLYEDVNSGTAYANVANLSTTTNGVITSENALFDEILGTTGTTGNSNTNIIDITDNTHPITEDLAIGNYDVGDAAFYVNNVVSGQKLGNHPNGQAVLIAWEEGDAMDTGTAPGRRAVLPLTNSNGGFNTNGEDLLVNAIIWTGNIDTDKDGIADHLDADSDDDGCNDAIEAYSSLSADPDSNDYYGTGNPPPVNADGTVVAASYQTPADLDSNSIYDFQEAGTPPSITLQPVNLTLCPGCNGSLTVTANNADGYQWQIFNGTTWVDLTDSGIHSGVTAATLNIMNATPSDNGNQYRVIVSNTLFVCQTVISNTAILTVNVTSVITNRRITYRVKKN